MCVDGHVLVTQPIEQRMPMGRVQNILRGVLWVQWAHAVGDRQQMQVVVAEQALRAAAHVHQTLQDAYIVRAAVDEIAQEVRGIAAGREVDV